MATEPEFTVVRRKQRNKRSADEAPPPTLITPDTKNKVIQKILRKKTSSTEKDTVTKTPFKDTAGDDIIGPLTNDSMAPSLPTKGTLATSMESIDPIQDPTITQVQDFQKRSANAPATIPCKRTKGGHSWIVEDEDWHKKRIGSPAAFAMPAFPDLPPCQDDFDALAHKKWENTTACHETVSFWNQETIDCIRRKFPGCLTELEVQPNALPADLTAKHAIDHVAKNVKTAAATQRDCTSLNRELMDPKCKPNAAGSVQCIKKCREIQQQVRELGLKSTISDEHIMSIAQSALLNSGHNKTHISKINVDWTSSQKTSFTDFASHCNRALKQLWEDGDRGKQAGSAHHAEELLKRITELETQAAANTADVEQCDDNIHEAAAMTQGHESTDDHSGGRTTPSSMSSLTQPRDEEAMIRRITDLALKQAGLPKRQQSDARTNNGAWRQCNKHCWSRGVSTHCDGTNCRPSCNKQPNHNPAATFDDKRGGSTCLEHRWMGWCGPDNKHCEDKADCTGPE